MAVDAARAKSLFLAASDLADPAERAAYLDRECGADAELRARVEALLRANDASPLPPLEAGDAASAHAPNGQPTTEDYGDPTARVGAILAGKYKLIEEIGEGGMGSVFMAQQTEPVKRAVAVKVIKAGMDSKAVLARFEAERQALALMDHPNIARVLDAGTTDSGRPFFVMELVKGMPITQFCDARKLTPRERLELFVPVCQAIQHAHQKGIIHRDIKPSNVLVAMYDDRPVPKVIDFGVAKAAGQSLTERTLMTGFGTVVGTPEYMSPEQATLNNLDIDTRSDVYALGVLLYELLTGAPPFSKKDLDKHSLLEILRVVREEEPPRPSTRLSTADALPTLSANRGTEPKKLTRLLRNELDWIVMKALEKDRARRYPTANGFAADVLRYLGGEAVQAHPPSTAYRLRKFVRRYKGPVLAASLLFLALVAGIVGTTLGLIEAKKQEAEAKRQESLALAAAEEERQAKLRERERAEGEKAAKLEAQKNLEQANTNLAFAKKSNEILGSVFTGLNPNRNYATQGEFSQALLDNLKKAVQELEGSAIGDPLTVAQMQITLGGSLLGLGEPSQAVALFEKARATRTAKLGPDHSETLVSMNALAVGYWAAGQLDLALPLHEETLKLRKARLGPDHPDTLQSMNNLADTFRAAGKLDLAVPLLEKTFKLTKARRGPYHPETLTSMDNLASGYRDDGKLEKALPLYEETVKVTKARRGPDHPDTLISMGNLAVGYWSAQQLDKSVPLFEETLKLQKRKLGRQHPETQRTVANLGVNYKDAGRVQEALPLLEEAFQTTKTNPKFHWVVPQLLDGYVKAGKAAEAAKLVRELPADARKQLFGDNSQLAGILARFGRSLLRARAFTEAEPLLRECLAIREKTQPGDWTTFNTMSLLGGALLGQKKYADAEPLLLKGYEGMKQREKTIPRAGGGELRIPEALDRLIELCTATNKPMEADKWRAERANYPQAKKPVAPDKK
jgi:serine/threonine protein kinase